MRTMLSAVVLFLFALSLQAQITVKSMTGHYDASVESIRPYVLLQNEGSETVDLNNYYVEYYIYDEAVTAGELEENIYTASPSVSSYSIEFSALDKVYEVDGKKANIKIRFSFANGSTIAAGSFVKLHQGINKIGWNYIFEEADDWSYAPNTNYTYNENVVVRDIATNEVVFGNDPVTGGSTVIPSTTLQWLGTKTFAQLSSIQIKEGDAFFNSDDKNSYVYFNGRWAQLAQCGVLPDGSVSFHEPVAGVSPTRDEHLATKGYVDDHAIDTTKLVIGHDGTISAPMLSDKIANDDHLITLRYLQEYIHQELVAAGVKKSTTMPASLSVSGFTAPKNDWNGVYTLLPSGYYQKGSEAKYIGNGNGPAIWVFGATPSVPYFDGAAYVVDNWPGATRTEWSCYESGVLKSFTLTIVSQ